MPMPRIYIEHLPFAMLQGKHRLRMQLEIPNPMPGLD